MKRHRLEKETSRVLRHAGAGKILAGISGGADSTALLAALISTGADVVAVHCNFHLRGEESDRDMKAAERLARSLGIESVTVHFDTEAYRKEHGLSLEEACRNLRYGEFRRIAATRGCTHIAVGHNADDNVETFLLNLMRGSGSRGLKGMETVKGNIIRPLLSFTRKEILEYLDEKGLPYVTDSSNLKSDFNRNFLRNEVIPLLKSRWPAASASIVRTMEILRAENQIIERAVDSRREDSPQGKTGRLIITVEEVAGVPDATPLIHGRLRGFRYNSAIVKEIDTVMRTPRPSGRRWEISIPDKPDRWILFTSDTDLRLINKKKPEESLKIRIEKISADPSLPERIKKEKDDSVLYLPFPPERIIFRRFREGDRIKPLGTEGSTLVSKIMKDKKVPFPSRPETIVAEDTVSGEVIWVCGLKRSRLFPVTSESPEVFRITPEPDE